MLRSAEHPSNDLVSRVGPVAIVAMAKMIGSAMTDFHSIDSVDLTYMMKELLYGIFAIIPCLHLHVPSTC